MRLAHVRGVAAPRRHRRRERGVALVEAAIALPIFFSMVLGVVDIGLGVLQTSQATSAAADGARVGILDHAEADVVGSADHDAIVEAVEGRLVGQDVDEIAVSCLTSSAASGGTHATSCASADADTDFLRVEVTWEFQPVSFIGHGLPIRDIEGSATMAIVRQPSSSDP
ncbi:pilus assembly protein [Iamia majanohamensis]|uniref:Pilus assembly protein n=1 Tax=Iamia majanohamensis TaxID=467976 RepID=A0AAF0BVH3_9ACTN|nr:TadE family protein [Iamia majanohamensis]WCO68872.1 pilus assembly protein [Iamia majanohamensis]